MALGSFDLTSGDFSSGQTLVTYVSGVRFLRVGGLLLLSSCSHFKNFIPLSLLIFRILDRRLLATNKNFQNGFLIMSTSLTLLIVGVTGLTVNIEVTRLQSLSRRSCDWGTVLKTVF